MKNISRYSWSERSYTLLSHALILDFNYSSLTIITARIIPSLEQERLYPPLSFCHVTLMVHLPFSHFVTSIFSLPSHHFTYSMHHLH